MQWFRNRRVRGRPPHPDVLTPAEWRVLEQVRRGLSNTEIAGELGLALPTVKMHVSNMLAKLDLPNRRELAAWGGEPAEESRVALRRFTLATPWLWFRESGAGGWAAKATMIGVGGAVVVGAVFALNAALRNVAAPASPPPASVTATPAADARAINWIEVPGLPAELTLEEVLDGAPTASGALDAGSGEWSARDPLPDGLAIATQSADRYWLVTDTDGSGELAVLDTESGDAIGIGAGWEGQVSSDGQWVALIPEPEVDTLLVIEVATGTRHDLGEFGAPVHLAWSTGNRLAIVHGVDATGLARLAIAAGPDWEPRQVGEIWPQPPVWSPDGDRLAYFDEEGYVTIATPSPASGTLDDVHATATPVVFPLSLNWSPDGTQLAVLGRLESGRSGATLEVVAVDGATNRPSVLTSLRDTDLLALGPQQPPHWSPDGRRIAFQAFDTTDELPLVAVVHADGSGAYRLATSVPLVVLGWDAAGVLVGATDGS